MTVPGVIVETILPPAAYGLEQIKFACRIAQMLDRGKLVLVEAPKVP